MTGKTLLAGAVCLVGLGVAALFATLGTPLSPPAGNAGLSPLSEDQRADVRATVRAYLIEHPDVVVEALEAMQARREAAEQARNRQALAAHRNLLVASPDDPTIGPDAASVTLVEFFDYQCPYCKRVTDAVMTLAEQDQGLRIVFKEFPILGDPSVLASRAALAARMQDKYIEFHIAMMNARGAPTMAGIERVAEAVGLDVAQLRADMDSPAVREAIEANYALARALGVTGTPAFIVGEQIVPGAVPIERLREMVADARKGGS